MFMIFNSAFINWYSFNDQYPKVSSYLIFGKKLELVFCLDLACYLNRSFYHVYEAHA